MNNYTFGNYICDLRVKAGLSQSQLGERLGVSNKAISKWENGGAYPSSDLMLPLAKQLGVSIEELYSNMSSTKTKKSKLRKFIDALVNKSPVITSVLIAKLALLWLLFIIFADTPDKTTILIAAPILPIIIYGFVRLMFLIIIKNPLASSKVIDIYSIFFIFASFLFLLTTILNIASDFPNGFYPSAGGDLGIISAVLHANKKRV